MNILALITLTLIPGIGVGVILGPVAGVVAAAGVAFTALGVYMVFADV